MREIIKKASHQRREAEVRLPGEIRSFGLPGLPPIIQFLTASIGGLPLCKEWFPIDGAKAVLILIFHKNECPLFSCLPHMIRSVKLRERLIKGLNTAIAPTIDSDSVTCDVALRVLRGNDTDIIFRNVSRIFANSTQLLTIHVRNSFVFVTLSLSIVYVTIIELSSVSSITIATPEKLVEVAP